MSQLEELIQQFCPDGVKYDKIKNAFSRLKGTPITASRMKEIACPDGEIRIFAGGKTIIDAHEKDIPKANITRVPAVLVQSRGIIDVIYYDKPFTFKNEMWAYSSSNPITTKFLYYVFKSNIENFREAASGMGALPQISLPVTDDFQIPVPPLEVQQEIVRILDQFTQLTAELNAELDAELNARKRQYEYYLNQILEFEDVPIWVELGTVTKSVTTGLNPRRFFKLNTDDASNYYVTIRELQNNSVVFSEKTDRINDEALRLCNNRSNLEIGDILFSGTGTIGETAVIEKTPINWNIKEGVYSIKPLPEKLNSRFLMYLLHTNKIRSEIFKKVAGGTVKSIPMGELRKLKIPVPPMSEQERLVNLIDRFDAVFNDLTSGLSAEIAARKRQYEYYWDKLLTFKEKA